jgi:hypothetical protein
MGEGDGRYVRFEPVKKFRISAMRRVRLSARRPIHVSEVELDLNLDELGGTVQPRSKLTPRSETSANANELAPPERIRATHNQGFLHAHRRRVNTIQDTFDKDWDDTARIRSLKSERIVTRVDPFPKQKDGHVLERVLHERNEEKWNAKAEPPGAQRLVNARNGLPRETRAFERRRQPIFFFG